ncbi:hypothetical protein HPO_05230 [Hyphomonas polymorpha PS728]|uniref:RiboL-PSP-HEPN domain-containing protein n=1 Tax=Hyphomonas polymorpha PS728 TaxID=1280954 RepID=A0A062VH38_9PROT|nr:hypothetical protein [Hyphomonas polymorpha]KCZ99763.1 hypothetical protein HPO_05230 [Hyphomonas polymorpha PS728]
MDTDRQFSSDPETRIADAIEAALEALRLASREHAGTELQPERWRWVALGLVSALQAALVAALSGYASARHEDVANPSQSDRVAPIALLLRRARSSEHLNAPERLDLTGAQVRGLEELVAMRNAAVHGLGFRVPENPATLARTAVDVIRHLLLTHPAFDMSGFVLFLSLIDRELTALDTALAVKVPGKPHD